MNRTACLLILSLVIVESQAQLTLTEVSSEQGFSDVTGASCDWIEVMNSGDESISLEGYSLSDDNDDWDAWTFPEHLLAPGEYILVLASGKDKPYLAEDWAFVVVDNVQWQYLVPSASLG